MEAYAEYKGSGVEWLGDIPADWKLKPGMVAFTENKRNNKGMKKDQVLSLSYGKIIVKPKEKLVGLVPESFETYQIIEAGDIVVRGTDLQNDKTSLRTGLAKDEGIITSAYISLCVSPKYSSKFLHYYLHTLDTSKVIYKYGTGLRQNLSFEDFKRLPVIDIPLPEQNAIADFLDDKVGKVEELVAIKKAQIALLKERKQILIQEAVTKGLNPDAPMKDSGIDWIGQIPAHWDRTPNKHLFRLKKVLVGKKSAEYDLLSLTLRGIIKRDMENPEGKFPAEFDTYQEVNDGDFVFCHFDVEETPRTVGLSTFDGMITGAYTVYERSMTANSRFLYLFYLCADTDKKMRSLYKGLRNTIPKDSFGAFKTPLPPLEEQNEIVKHIDKMAAKIDGAITIKENQITKLNEYKVTLINAAVTGKIKVPEQYFSKDD